MPEIPLNSLTDPFIFQCDKVKVAGRGIGNVSYFGLQMAQNQNAIIVWDTFFKYLAHEKIDVGRIIELGTGAGGFSVLLSVYCQTVGADFITYDFDEKQWPLKHKELFRRLQVDRRLTDLDQPETIKEISDLIEQDGTTILLCDARKVKDWQDFAEHLKPGDFIASHDYAPSQDYFVTHMVGRIWSHIYLQDREIESICREHNLEPVSPEMFLTAAWTCRRKTIDRNFNP